MKNLITLTAIFFMTANSFAQQSPWIYYKGQGQDQLYKKDYYEALKSFSACIKENEKADECYVGRGNAQLGLQNISAARTAFEKALKINPKNKEAKDGLAKNPSEDAPMITAEGFKQQRKLTEEDKKTLDNVRKSREKLYKSIPEIYQNKTEKQQEKKPETKKPEEYKPVKHSPNTIV